MDMMGCMDNNEQPRPGQDEAKFQAITSGLKDDGIASAAHELEQQIAASRSDKSDWHVDSEEERRKFDPPGHSNRQKEEQEGTQGEILKSLDFEPEDQDAVGRLEQ